MNRKKLLITILFIAAGIAVNAQAPIGKGQSQINAGLGFSGWGVPVYVGVDFGVHEDITVGGELSFRSYHDSWSGTDYNHTIFGIGANGNYHFNRVLNIPKEWDLYAGLTLGYYIWGTSDASYGGTQSSGLGLGAQVGGRYYFSQKFGVNLEFGGGNNTSGGKIGVTIRL
jgi:outer membrane immunogenic protein